MTPSPPPGRTRGNRTSGRGPRYESEQRPHRSTVGGVFDGRRCRNKVPQMGWLNATETYPHSSGGQRSEVTVLAGLVLPEALRDNCPCRSPCLWWLPAVLGVPWLVNTSLPSLPLLIPGILPVSHKNSSHWIEGPPSSRMTSP